MPTKIMLICAAVIFWAATGSTAAVPVSAETQECIQCHSQVSPGIVADWKNSRHSKTSPSEAEKLPQQQRRVSSAHIPEKFKGGAIGCAECHTMNAGDHKDSVEHNGFQMHLTVTPKDCAVCHEQESAEYSENLMAHAYGNLAHNPVFRSLEQTVNATPLVENSRIKLKHADSKTEADSCYHCHGTKLEVQGSVKRETEMGEMEFVTLSGWPNQGTGRINLDGSKGSCAACHSRHRFSIETARKPATCSQCHKGPDVPAYRVYEVSKHGNLYASHSKEWNFTNVPWTLGADFTAPTCAACHASLVVGPEGEVIAPRTHRMNDRLPWRILGLVYAHPHTKSPDTTIVRNRVGLPLPTDMDGTPAQEFLIDEKTRVERRDRLQKVCLACHGRTWVVGHWARFENTIAVSNEITKTSTDIMTEAWKEKAADPGNMFDEGLEKKWVAQWLFYANNTRFASAMMGADYGVFEDGRWHLTRNLQEMWEQLQNFLRAKPHRKGAVGEK